MNTTEQWVGTCARCGRENVECIAYANAGTGDQIATCEQCHESLREKKYYRCLECHEYTASASSKRAALASLSSHVSKMHRGLGWGGYLLEHELWPCEGCGRPLDQMKISRCYDCRIECDDGTYRLVEG